MIRTRFMVLAALALIIVGGALVFGAITLHDAHPDTVPQDEFEMTDEAVQAFASELENRVSAKRSMKLEGLTPEDIMEAIPGIILDDFNGVEAVLGTYIIQDGRLAFSNEESIDGAAGDLTSSGYATLRTNIYTRLNLDMRMDAATALEELQTGTAPQPAIEIPPATPAGTICPEDTKICPDGSSVGREGLNCEFAACPGEGEGSSQSVACQPDQRLVDMCTEQYEPVCAAYQVRCIKAPCDPVPKTYSNSCFACMDKNVISYTAGACREE